MTVSDRFKGFVFLLAGICLLVGTAVSIGATRNFLARTETAPGLVIGEPIGPHHVDVRFRTRQGQVLTYGQNGLVTLHTGERVTVRYDPRDPAMDPCVDQWQALWDWPLSLGLLGSVFTLVGGGLVWANRSKA